MKTMNFLTKLAVPLLVMTVASSALAVDFKTLPFNDAIKVVKGNGKRHMAIFSDPNCMPSNDYQAQLERLTDVTMHIFVVPLKGTDSVNLSQGIMCSSNQGKTFIDWMVAGKMPEARTCNAVSLTRNIPLLRSVGADSTPYTILPDGSVMSGAAPASEVEKRLQRIYGAPASRPVAVQQQVSQESNESAAPASASSFFK